MPLSNAERLARGHPVWAEVDLAAIRHNVRVLAERAGGAEIMGVVKGYAYGHGNPASALAMLQAGATRLGVARLAEGLHLREAGIEAPMHLFTETPLQGAPAIVEAKLTPSVYSDAFARALSDAAMERGEQIAVHVKLDTGMHRVGILADELDDALDRIVGLPGIRVEGLWSHLAVADVPDHPFTRKQLELFEELCARAAARLGDVRYRHIANSAATISTPDSHYELVRCGIAAYGLWPGEHLRAAIDLKPALSLRARIGQVKRIPAGDAVSYGLNYELARPGNIVTIGAGYADGYDRRLSGEADVVIGGHRYKVSGTVCMDQFMVDVGAAKVNTDEVATLIGSDGAELVTAEELAGLIGTINYEITSRIPSRVPRIYLDEEQE